MYKWDQSAGALTKDGALVSRGYSGAGRGKNNPSMQAARAVGPIPRGRWRMTAVNNSPNTGPFTITLEAEPGTDTCGRSEFRVHGDSVAHPGEASHGCIILPRAVREAMWRSGDREIEVIE